MIRRIVCVVVAFAGIVACGGEDTSGSTGNPTVTKASGDDYGPQCKAYVACCKDAAAKSGAGASQVNAACDSFKQQYEQGRKSGASVDQFESACSSGLSSLKATGLCK